MKLELFLIPAYNNLQQKGFIATVRKSILVNVVLVLKEFTNEFHFTHC